MRKNRLLSRQLKKCEIDTVEEITPEKFEKFLELVESSYNGYEKSLNLLDRSLEIASEEMREALEKNKKQTEQMLKQSRLASMGEMVSMIAHQWRQPLNAISLTATDLKIKISLGELDMSKITEGLEKIVSHVQHLSDTVEDFRRFFKSEKSMAETTFKDIVESIETIIETTAKNSSIDINYRLDKSCIFKSYPNELKQAILNLVKNAEDVLIERGVKRPRIEIVSRCDERKSYLEIRDNGGGVPPEILEHIFEPDFSTKKDNGTGVGLYMTKIIVEEHCGGRLKVENNKEGATFTIELNR
ncbi:MAG: HAMP domain-containing histidine kinase [Hydrogenimonas sp.]|nr:HAMP domain-containing histidine kinase [Hydrogenimonas sp.]